MVAVDPAELSALAEEIFVRTDVPQDTARTVACSLIDADLSGHHSHGVRLLPKYVKRLGNGMIDPAAEPETVLEDGPLRIIDGHSALGQYVGGQAIEAGLELVKNSGVSIVSVRNATHLGCIGTLARRATDEGAIFLGFVCNPTSTMVAPPGTATGRLSTNPVSIGLPTYDALEYPVIVDIATSQVAFGKIGEFAADDRPVPDEWTAPYDGKPDSEPVLNGSGALLPLGGSTAGYKGFGLAVATELVAGIVGDSPVSGHPEASYGNVATFVFINPLRFSTKAAIEKRILSFEEYVLSGEQVADASIGIASSDNELLLPGEPEHRNRTAQSSNGITIRPADASALRQLAADLGITDASKVLSEE